MKQIIFVFLIASTFCHLVNSVAPGGGPADTTNETESAFKKANFEFKIPISSHIYVVNGTKLGEFLSDEFKRILEEEEAKTRQVRDTNQEARPYLIHGNLEAIPLN
uniref:Secreted protein n=1 Tax=Panagrolaimus superbus TaxID=310955 RepID=A0A914YXA4_9BILA